MPKSVRSMVGSGDDFSYRVHYRFHRDAFDEAHPFRYTTEFPVLSERIKVEGRQWPTLTLTLTLTRTLTLTLTPNLTRTLTLTCIEARMEGITLSLTLTLSLPLTLNR